MAEGATPTPSINVQSCNSASGSRIVRSPSRESIATELSLFSLSSITSASEFLKTPGIRVSFRSGDQSPVPRGPSPNPGSRSRLLRVPGACHASSQPIQETWFEEESEVIKSCGALSSALGLQKSFSTSDITALAGNPVVLRQAVSDLAMGCVTLGLNKALDVASRSCSTWVAVGDVATTSQLPSPQGRPYALAEDTPLFTAADLIRSVNKRVRQNYIRKRLLTTYRALERLSLSQFDLDSLGAAVAASNYQTSVRSSLQAAKLSPIETSKSSLTEKDVERERGKPLSKYDRNMMIFNWLHTLDDTDETEPMLQ